MKKNKTLEHMIENNLDEISADPWVSPKWWSPIKDLKGQVNYRGKIFFIQHFDGPPAYGGRVPDYAIIYHIEIPAPACLGIDESDLN